MAFSTVKCCKTRSGKTKKVHNLEEARKLTNTQSLSLKKSALAEELITKAFIKNSELN
jgi:hypothetical protein